VISVVGKKAVPHGATNSSLWLWVPAFAGTTVEIAFEMRA
jgi:hypothetical protein